MATSRVVLATLLLVSLYSAQIVSLVVCHVAAENTLALARAFDRTEGVTSDAEKVEVEDEEEGEMDKRVPPFELSFNGPSKRVPPFELTSSLNKRVPPFELTSALNKRVPPFELVASDLAKRRIMPFELKKRSARHLMFYKRIPPFERS